MHSNLLKPLYGINCTNRYRAGPAATSANDADADSKPVNILVSSTSELADTY